MELLSLLIMGLAGYWFLKNHKKNNPRQFKDQETRFRGVMQENLVAQEKDFTYYGDHQYTPPLIEQYWNDITESVKVDSQLRLDYTNAKGEDSRRDVDIDYYDGSCYLCGFCHLRNDQRTFRIDRVKGCVDRETGEIISDIPGYLRAKYELSPEYLFSNMTKTETAFVRVLFYVGKADSQLRAPERKIIRSVFRDIVSNQQLTDKSIDYIINDLEILSIQAFKLAVGKIAKENNSKLEDLLEKAEQIVKTQKTVHPSEQEALDYIAKKINQDVS